MFEKLLPRTIDNTYRGYKAALWLFGVVVLMKALQMFLIILNGDSTARDADGIPLGTFPPDAVKVILAVLALMGLARLITYLLFALVLVRYRSLITFMFGLLVLEYVGRELILYFLPIIRTGTPISPIMNQVLFALTIVGLALSLPKRGIHT
jgi:hypothetical protein